MAHGLHHASRTKAAPQIHQITKEEGILMKPFPIWVTAGIVGMAGGIIGILIAIGNALIEWGMQ